jgi:drug/metabolite transporter (DMT)-like permease
VTLRDEPRSEVARAPTAALWLIVATALWGAGFSWGKVAQDTINRAGPGAGSAVGPIFTLAARFLLAGVIWMVVVARARRGWTFDSLKRALLLGALLAGGIVLQHLALDRTSEAVTAFLTTLSIVFVPMFSAMILRRPPTWVLCVGGAIALLGMWRMTGGSPRGFGLGELLGVACALVFSLHLLAVNELVPKDDPLRLLGGQFLFIGLLCLITLPFLNGGLEMLRPQRAIEMLTLPKVWPGLLALTLLSGIAAFGLMMVFQPRLDPTRAALIYLFEPVWAGVYAWVFAGSMMTPAELQGAALLLAANVFVEGGNALRQRRNAE